MAARHHADDEAVDAEDRVINSAPKKAGMEALAALPNIRAAKLSAGKLAVHEEYPDMLPTRSSFLVDGSPRTTATPQ